MFITEIKQGLKNEVKWKKELDHFESGNGLLKKEKFQYPLDQKLNIDNVKGSWNNFKQILKKRSEVMENEIPQL